VTVERIDHMPAPLVVVRVVVGHALVMVPLTVATSSAERSLAFFAISG
jgi:hypothetical protein